MYNNIFSCIFVFINLFINMLYYLQVFNIKHVTSKNTQYILNKFFFKNNAYDSNIDYCLAYNLNIVCILLITSLDLSTRLTHQTYPLDLTNAQE